MQFSAVLAILAMTSSVFAIPAQTGPKASQEDALPAHLAQFKAETLAKLAELTKLNPNLESRDETHTLYKRGSCWGCIASQVFSDYGSVNVICCHEGGPCYGNQCACGIC
ncbi:unnamed protein product [Zymoseptoria tritici ST99CH_3D7]|uniref:Invertebrate defensins family profile domain-containing protein n=1 Tax=Zymoseptoria tritici (strain ST99CH_3D7) TaxID=1276538 RepID=A0A1X7RVU7_ZYMT9|nr:unnamed protein product [Zymoseptoria tritici ST99CH_3D7]